MRLMPDLVNFIMKQAVLNILGFVGNLAPDWAWRAILRVFLENKSLVGRYGMFFLSQLASQRNLVINASVVGRHGIFASAPNDCVVLKAYAENGTWASSINSAIKNFFAEGQGTYSDISANIDNRPRCRVFSWNCFAFEPWLRHGQTGIWLESMAN